jgi:hypothetical protein
MCSIHVDLRNASKLLDGNPHGKKYFVMPGRRQEDNLKIYGSGVKLWLLNLIRIGSNSWILLLR